MEFETFSSQEEEGIVIIGGGIQGVSIAYYLMKRGVRCTIIEEVCIAAAASGKAGGFLAKNWGDSITAPLHHLSYKLHSELAEELNLESYRELRTMSVKYKKENKRKLDSEMFITWIDKSGVTEDMDTETAQVLPLELTTKLVEAVVAFGSVVLIGRVIEVMADESGRHVSGVKYVANNEVKVLRADKLVLATGPWAGVHARDWLGVNIPIKGIKSTSIVYEDCPEIVLDEYAALFCDEDSNGCHLEIYPRNSGEIYICGCGKSEEIAGDQLREGGVASSAACIKPSIDRVHAAARSFSALSSIGNRWPSVSQACMRPLAEDSLPVMGIVNGAVEGVYISAGHNCWGILWAPASGLCMSDVILNTNGDHTSSALDLTPFSPNRFATPPVDLLNDPDAMIE